MTPEKWDGLKVALRESYDRVKGLINDTTAWPSEREIGGAIAMIVHTAYITWAKFGKRYVSSSSKCHDCDGKTPNSLQQGGLMSTRTTKRPAGEPTWFDLATPDVKIATNFYQAIFGWSYIDTGPDFGNYHFAQSDGRNVAGIGPIWPPDSPQPSVWTVYFASEDAAADCERVKELGGQVMVEPMVISDSGSMAICMDPTGAAFGFWQANQHIGSGAENEHGSMTWCEVNTRDSAAAREFYSKLLNVTTSKMEGMDYYMIQRGDDMLAGILQMDEQWEGIPPHWMAYFAVDNTDVTIERAVAAGGKLQVPAFDMAYGRMAVLSDPAGATFSIVQLAQPA